MVLWQHDTGGYVVASPVVVNGVLYVSSYSSDSGNLYAFHLPNH
jgi:outer membrane protein assembly factor BamB